MRPAVKGPIGACALDLLIVELTHRRSGHECVKGRRRQLTVVVVRATQTDQHVALCLVVAHALDKAAAWGVGAGKRL